jgi:predicted TIM-barrel fold metal-dependent hydrolase
MRGEHSFDVRRTAMKIIALEEHYGLPVIHDAALKANDPYALVLETLKKAGHFPDDPKTGFPAGIYDLGEGRIAGMDAAGIDVAVLSYATPSVERLEPSLAKDLARQANDTLAAAISKYPDRLLGFATLPMLDPAAAARELPTTAASLPKSLHFSQLPDRVGTSTMACTASA